MQIVLANDVAYYKGTDMGFSKCTVKIYDDAVTFDFHGILKSNGSLEPKSYSQSFVPQNGILEEGFGGYAKALVFVFPQFTLDTDEMIKAASNVNTGKNNAFGNMVYGPFAWGAGVLHAGGSKNLLKVDSPYVGRSWDAKDLAKYCSRIRIAASKEAFSFMDI